MTRDLSKLSDREFDILIVGAGINGACVARDAARRGLSVAIIDRADIGSTTSFNSLRTVHGGLRYLQHLDFKRMRESIRERTNWLRIAPHLVHPLPFMAATTQKISRTKTAFRVAFAINDSIGFDRNRDLDIAHRIPGGRILSSIEARKHYPGSDAKDITGGAVWYDAQMYDSERLVLAVLNDAVASGATIANYTSVDHLIVSENRVIGAVATDTIDGGEYNIKAKLTIITAGPLVDKLLNTTIQRTRKSKPLRLSKAMNILTRRIAGNHAVGVPSQYHDPNAAMDHGTRLLFITPWRDLSLIGTTHVPFDGKPQDFRITTSDVQQFVNEINAACPEANLTLDDVKFVFAGLLPAGDPRPGDTETRLLQHHRIVDHESEDNLKGIISLTGVKYTTARLAAEQVTDLACTRLGIAHRKCDTAIEPLSRGDIGSTERITRSITERWGDRLPEETILRMVRLYGGETERMLEGIGADADEKDGVVNKEDLLKAQIRFAIKEEYAVRLSDIVYRRADLAARGTPDDDILELAAKLMGSELGWNVERRIAEIDDVRKTASAWRSPEGMSPLRQEKIVRPECQKDPLQGPKNTSLKPNTCNAELSTRQEPI